MSEFLAEVVRVGPVIPHINADRLAVAKVFDYDCVVGLHYLNEGDLALYIPEGAIVTDAIIACLGGIKLAGSNYNRVKATKIRGILSQGLLLSVRDINTARGCDQYEEYEEGQDLSEVLGITKWDPEVASAGDPNRVKFRAANAYHCPDRVVTFDVENIKKIRKFFTAGEDVVATEKIHGTFCQIRIFSDGDIVITSKGLAKKGDAIGITQEEEVRNVYLQVGLPIARTFLSNYLDMVKDFGSVTFLGEIYGKGVQDLHYNQETPAFACFDVMLGKDLLNFDGWLSFCRLVKVQTVPVVAATKFDMDLLADLAAQPSSYGNNLLREGVVIRAVNDSRRKAKVINPAYLLRKGGSEFN